MKTNPIGIVQGRLSPRIGGLIQVFPYKTWQDEFKIASDIGFDAIELIFDGYKNPLYTINEAKEIKELSEHNNILLSSVSADCTMYHPLFGRNDEKHLKPILKLIRNCSEIEIPRINISFEDNSAILIEMHRNQAIRNMQECLKIAEELDIIITIETDLSVLNVINFISRINSPNLRINFDIGNSCAHGEDTPNVIKTLNNLIGGIHIKDRNKLFGSTVPLGHGEVNFKECFDAIKKIQYGGAFIIQGARGDNDIETAKSYLEFVRKFLNEESHNENKHRT